MHSIRRHHIPSVILTMLVMLTGCTAPVLNHGIQRVIAVGDSNIDTGNLYRMSEGKFPAPPNWQGRNANGPVVVEYLANQLGAKLESYAISGATSGTLNIVGKVYPAHAALVERGTNYQLDNLAATGVTFNTGDLIVLWTGSNDIFDIVANSSGALNAAIEQASLNVEKAIIRLNRMGATRFVVANRTPRETLGSENDRNGELLNLAVADAVARARKQTNADVRLFDAYKSVADMMRRPEAYGFLNAETLCIRVPACANDTAQRGYPVASRYINWDGAHKTTRVHQEMAHQIKDLVAR